MWLIAAAVCSATAAAAFAERVCGNALDVYFHMRLEYNRMLRVCVGGCGC